MYIYKILIYSFIFKIFFNVVSDVFKIYIFNVGKVLNNFLIINLLSFIKLWVLIFVNNNIKFNRL